MELLQPDSPLLAAYSSLSISSRFSLIDAGCSGGIDRIFLRLGEKFRALGIDASVDEIAKLNRLNTHQNIKYVDGLLGMSNAGGKADSPPLYWRLNPWKRLSACVSMELRGKKTYAQDHDSKMENNLWQQTSLSEQRLILPDIMARQGFSDVDLLKIDIDGPDYLALRELDGRFREFGLLAVCMEVNFFGGHAEEEHVFHNTDRFMRRNGFDLFGLTVRPYSAAALPFRFQYGFPAQTVRGRPLQGDALYVRDICSDAATIADVGFSKEKIIHLVIIFSLFGLPDFAAEIFIHHADALIGLIDVNQWLDLLTRQLLELQLGKPRDVSNHHDLLAKYRNDDSEYYFGLNNVSSPMDAVAENNVCGPDADMLRRLIDSSWRKIGLWLGMTRKMRREK